MDQIQLAKRIATKAHKGQMRRDGVTPYIEHPKSVASRVTGRLKAVAWLHDVLEDTPVTAWDLMKAGVDDDIVKAVLAITKESYKVYLWRVEDNDMARAVKIADMKANLADKPTRSQQARYTKGIKLLEKKEAQ